MAILAIIITIALGVLAGRAVIRHFGRKGHGRAACLAAGISTGAFVWLATLVIAIGIIDPEPRQSTDKVAAGKQAEAPSSANVEPSDTSADDTGEKTGNVADELPQEPHLSIAIDEVEGRVNQRLQDMGVDQIFRVHKARSDAEVYGGRANDAATVMMTATNDGAYLTHVTVSYFTDDDTDVSNRDARTTTVALMAVIENESVTTMAPVYNRLVEGLAKDGRDQAQMSATYRLYATSSNSAQLTIDPK